MTLRLRQYQLDALEAEQRHRAETPDETRLAIVLPTGTGKAITLAERARQFIEQDWEGAEYGDTMGFKTHRRRVMILVHTDELVSQLEVTVRLVCGPSELPISVGVVKADRDETGADIIVASVQTLARPERRHRITDVGLAIVDECHHAAAPTYQEILRYYGCYDSTGASTENDQCCGGFTVPGGETRRCSDCIPPTPALGFTATLERGDGAGLGSVWQDVAYTRDISWAVRKGFLVEPIGYRLEIDVHGGPHGRPDTFSTVPGYQDDQLMESLAPEKIVEKWQELAGDRKTVAFMPLVRSAQALCAEFVEAGIDAAVIHGDMDPDLRRRTIKRYRAGDIQVLCNAMVLTEGFDDPATSCVIVGRPTKSRSLFIQMAGRGLRPVPGVPVEDQNCILISLADATTDLCSIADLSDRLSDRKADGPLTVMEDAYDIGRDLEEAARHWTGRVDATRFDPIVAARSKVWACTKAGHWFLPISKDREYVFLLDGPDGNTDIYVLTRHHVSSAGRSIGVHRVQSVPDQELAFSLAEDEASERGGDVGALLADRTRAWRKQKPGDKMLDYARRLGLATEVDRIMSATAGGKAGKVSDLIRRVEASRSIDKAAQQVKERRSA
jgi:superfamily II DNA or RNA helicase